MDRNRAHLTIPLDSKRIKHSTTALQTIALAIFGMLVGGDLRELFSDLHRQKSAQK